MRGKRAKAIRRIVYKNREDAKVANRRYFLEVKNDEAIPVEKRPVRLVADENRRVYKAFKRFVRRHGA